MKDYLILKFLSISIILTGLLYVLEFGVNFDHPSNFVAPLLLSIFSTIMIFKQSYQRYGLFLSLGCLAVMILVAIFNLLDLSSKIGSFGFSLFMITIILYLPQIIKKGRIERY